MSGYLFEKRSISDCLGYGSELGGVRIGGRRSGRAHTGCRGCAIGLLACRRCVGLAGSCVGAGRMWHGLGLTLSLRLGGAPKHVGKRLFRVWQRVAVILLRRRRCCGVARLTGGSRRLSSRGWRWHACRLIWTKSTGPGRTAGKEQSSHGRDQNGPCAYASIGDRPTRLRARGWRQSPYAHAGSYTSQNVQLKAKHLYMAMLGKRAGTALDPHLPSPCRRGAYR